jgi:hypothetical protein
MGNFRCWLSLASAACILLVSSGTGRAGEAAGAATQAEGEAVEVSDAMSPQDLVQLFGYDMEHLDVGGPYSREASGPDREAERKGRMETALARIKEEIRAGRPALLVQAFTMWEYDVVCGFDEETHELYGRGSYAGLEEYAHADEMRALGATEIGGGPYAILIGEKSGQFDARTAELAALREAVAHAHSGGVGLAEGLECYDLWINRYRRKGSFMVPKETPSDEYSLGILPSTRQAASQFMSELAEGYPKAKANLEMAGDHFALEAAALGAARTLRAGVEDPPSEEQCVRMAGLLSSARAMYALAIDEIARALPKMEGQASDAAD